MTAARVLDSLHSLAQVEALDPDGVRTAFAAEAAALIASVGELEQISARLETTVTALDAMGTRAMKLRLEHVLARDSSIAPPTRNVFAATVTAYTGRLPLLAERARDVAVRGGARDANDVATRVVEAASAVLTLRERVIEGLLAVVRENASASVAAVDAHARDRRASEVERRRASALRRELEAIAADPARIADGTVAERLAAWPEQLDEPDPASEPSWADMIEID